MDDVNQKSEEGAREFKDLETQMEKLEPLFDSAKSAGDRWEATLDQIKAKQCEPRPKSC
jgi:hypothetical protein